MGGSLDDAIGDVMLMLLGINEQWPGDYALFVKTAVTPEAALTHFEWYYKPPSAGAAGTVAQVTTRPPGYDPPEGPRGGPLPPAWRQGEHGIAPIPERFGQPPGQIPPAG